MPQLSLLELGPDRIAAELARLDAPQPLLPHLVMPAHHDVRAKDVIPRRLHGALAAAADAGPTDFADLLLVPGVGPRTVLSLALVAEVLHGAPCRFADPARFSLAHGGKDNGGPGERSYHPGYYAAFVLDPDGNNIEAVYHGQATRSAASVRVTF